MPRLYVFVCCMMDKNLETNIERSRSTKSSIVPSSHISLLSQACHDSSPKVSVGVSPSAGGDDD